MRFTKETLVTAFAIFSMFFGAGNLILPPYLGLAASGGWTWVTLGFVASAVVIPILGIYGHAKLQGTMLDFANKIHRYFSLVFCTLIYVIAVSLPSPRTASVTYEMAIEPYFNLSSLAFSVIYFALVLLFVLNRSRILDILGKYLTPLLLFILTMIIGVGIFGENVPGAVSEMTNPLTEGILEGYQTFDAIAGIVVGAVIIISLRLKHNIGYAEKKKLIARGGLLAGIALLLIYAGLIYLGASYSGTAPADSRTELLSVISYDTLGSGGRMSLAVLIGLACFTTAVGIVTGTADFIKGIFRDSQLAYIITAVIGCIVGILIGSFNTDFIIEIAVPVLFMVYPLTIILILLNVIPNKFTSPTVFRWTAATTLLFSLPDLFHGLNLTLFESYRTSLPLGDLGMGWLLPSIATFIIVNILELFRPQDPSRIEAEGK